MGEDKFKINKGGIFYLSGDKLVPVNLGITNCNINNEEDNEMEFVSKDEYEKAIEKMEKFEKRENKIKEFKTELGKRLQDFDKFTFRIKNNRTIFAGYFADKYDKDHVVIGETICDDGDVFDKLLGKLIAVRKALGLKIDDIVEVVEPKKKSDIISVLSGNGQTFTFSCNLM